MNLIIDIGNTRVKASWFEGRESVEYIALHVDEFKRRFETIKSKYRIENTGIGNVNALNTEWLSFDENTKVMALTPGIGFPIKNDYQTPDTLGIDRISAAVAGTLIFPNNAVLTIDIGTCITYDLVDYDQAYKGGGIAPGYKMRLDAMHAFTKRLPLVEPLTDLPEIGANTEDSMLFGAGRGIVAEIDGIIDRFKGQYPNLKVILTGGDHSMFEQHIENAIFAAPNLVLEGMNEILLYNLTLND